VFAGLDFALILVIATAVTGVVWLLDALVLAPRRIAAAGDASVADPVVVEYSKSFFPVLLIVLLLRSFVFEPFRIPSGSMMPTLLTGDFIFVNKFSYGLRLPVLNTKILDIGQVERGDVVVFRYPPEPSINYIKRVVGLPGDVIEYSETRKELTINGVEVPIMPVGDYPDQAQSVLVRETLGAHEHEALWMTYRDGPGGIYRVPEGHYFMMGDNRDNSEDSRFPDAVGFVPEENLVGRAEIVWMSWQKLSEGGPRWGRIGNSID
jgi:signal peptidase I